MRHEGLIQHIQLVEFDTSQPVDEVREAIDEWLTASRGKRRLQMAVVAADRDRPNHYWELLEFPSAGAAAESAELPETKAALEKWLRLVDGEPVFHNLDVVQQFGGPWTPPVDAGTGSTPGAG
jgi:quinol monooxygenase YgiN